MTLGSDLQKDAAQYVGEWRCAAAVPADLGLGVHALESAGYDIVACADPSWCEGGRYARHWVCVSFACKAHQAVDLRRRFAAVGEVPGGPPHGSLPLATPFRAALAGPLLADAAQAPFL